MKKVTIRDVAKKCGKSRQVVSVVLNNKDYISVSEDTRAEILRTAETLNYSPNLSARSLVKGTTGCIGFINSIGYQNAYPYYHTQIVNGIEEGLQETGDYTLLMFGTNLSGTFDRSLSLIEQGAVDGLILNVFTRDIDIYNRTVFPALEKKGIPFVVIHSTSKKLKGCSVGLNGKKGGELACKYILSKGYRGVKLYLAEPGNPRYREPMQGFKKKWINSGRTWNDSMILKGKDSTDTFGAACEYFRSIKNPPDALFIPDDVTALAALQVLREKGVDVPGQTAVVGFDDLNTWPLENPLTTLYHPFREKGKEAVSMLGDLLAGNSPLNPQIILDPQLIIRASA